MNTYWLNLPSQDQKTPLFITPEVAQTLQTFLQEQHYSTLVVLVDEHTLEHCLPIIDSTSDALLKAEIIEISSGESQKNIEVCYEIWETLYELKADRNTLIIALGGGVVTDIAGFIASTYQRGISYINIPTTLMAQADASIANKTGINWRQTKNQIGTFYVPDAVFIDPVFLRTISLRELKSGMAEIYKHALISDLEWWKELSSVSIHTSEDIPLFWLEKSVQIKTKFVMEDPQDKGVRKTLNFGHTIGHALESCFQNTNHPLLHGEAIVMGMCVEAHLSFKLNLISKTELDHILNHFHHHYPELFKYKIPTEEVMHGLVYDKKNKDGKSAFTLLHGIGRAVYDRKVDVDLVLESLQIISK